MAITVLTSPTNGSLNDSLWHTVSSTNVAQSNFKFVFDVYINSSLVLRVKQFPDPANNYAAFDASNVVRSYIQSYFKPQDAFYCYDNDGFAVDYQIKYGEEYGGTLYSNLTTASYRAYNYYRDIDADWDANQNLFTNYANGGKWLTDKNLGTFECDFSQKSYINWVNVSGVTSVTPSIIRYTEGFMQQDVSGFTAITSLDNLVLFNIGPEGMNQLADANYITENTWGYGLKLTYNNGGSVDSEIIKVKMSCNPVNKPLSLHFMNQLGGFESFQFDAVNKQTRNFERKDYKSANFQWDGSSYTRFDPNSDILLNSGVTRYSTKHTADFLLRSGYVSESTFTHLLQLIASNEVYLTFPDKDLHYPVIIQSNSWEEKKRANDKMFNLELNIQIALDRYSQFR